MVRLKTSTSKLVNVFLNFISALFFVTFFFFTFLLRLETVDGMGKLSASEVGLHFLAAPINPSDLNLVR